MSTSRAQLIKQARHIRRIAGLIMKARSIFSRPTAVPRHEFFIDTEFGRARVLGYGLDDPHISPVLIDMHGGGFVLGQPEMDEGMNVEFRARVGCKVISIDYAKAPEQPFPAAVNQVYAMAQHVREHAKEFKVDASRMAIGGHSAGGNLAAVVCLKAKQQGEFQFACQLLDYPPLDLGTNPFDKPRPKGAIPPDKAAMFDACYLLHPADKHNPLVSPVYATRQQLEGLPPALVIAAGGDSLHDEALRYADMLEAAGVAVERHDYPNSAHGFTYQPSLDASDARSKMAAFLNRHLNVQI